MSARTIEQWYETFTSMPGPANAVNCALKVVQSIWEEPGARNDMREADDIANAMLAFKRVGRGTNEVPEEYKQSIYLSKGFEAKFIDHFIKKGWWFEMVQQGGRGSWKMTFAERRDLKADLPTSLHGKFSVNP